MRVALVGLLALGCNSDTGITRIKSPPEVGIAVPELMQEFRKGEGVVEFVGHVQDAFDRPDTMDITWYLDSDTPMAPAAVSMEGLVGLDMDLEALELGEHLIELEAIDSDGEWAKLGIPFVVLGALSAPTVTITDPANGSLFAPGEQITFQGEATDNNTDPGDIDFEWISSIDGPVPDSEDFDDDGRSLWMTDSLSPGTHVITLRATDIDGEVGQDQIEIAVGDIVEPPGAEPGDLVFSEMMINPEAVLDELGEWVELYNTSGYAIDVTGYSFHDKDYDQHTLVGLNGGPLIVGPKDYIVLCAELDKSINGGVPCDGPFKREASGELALGNGTDEVILSRPDGVIIDSVYYDENWFDKGIAIGLDPDMLDASNNDDESMWCNQTTVISTSGEPGTPGRRNDDC